MIGFHELGNEHLGSIKAGNFWAAMLLLIIKKRPCTMELVNYYFLLL
jgi:hypothetical protein